MVLYCTFKNVQLISIIDLKLVILFFSTQQYEKQIYDPIFLCEMMVLSMSPCVSSYCHPW